MSYPGFMVATDAIGGPMKIARPKGRSLIPELRAETLSID